jgi:hypothetical protein
MMDEDNRDILEKQHHPSWKIRFVVGLIMLFLAFLGMIVTDIKLEWAWVYWMVIIPLYAVLSIGLSLYLHHKKLREAIVTVWIEILHWAALIAAVFLVAFLVKIGFLSRFQAGVEMLTLLALATFLAGVYIEKVFMLVGVVLGLLVMTVALVTQNVYLILIPLALAALIALIFISRRRSKKRENPNTDKQQDRSDDIK